MAVWCGSLQVTHLVQGTGWLEGCLVWVTAGHPPGAGHRLAGGLFGVCYCSSPGCCRAHAGGLEGCVPVVTKGHPPGAGHWHRLAGWNAVWPGSLEVTNLVQGTWHRLLAVNPCWAVLEVFWDWFRMVQGLRLAPQYTTMAWPNLPAGIAVTETRTYTSFSDNSS